ncbi:MAG: hypothetical protein WBY93_00135 [Candidatus Binatus sp.]
MTVWSLADAHQPLGATPLTRRSLIDHSRSVTAAVIAGVAHSEVVINLLMPLISIPALFESKFQQVTPNLVQRIAKRLIAKFDLLDWRNSGTFVADSVVLSQNLKPDVLMM